MCERLTPDNFTINILGSTTTEPSSLLPFNAVVKDQNGVAQSGRKVTISVDVQEGTGGHLHTENRPKGTFTCSSALGTSPAICTLTTDSSGQAPFEFVATPISGTHTITATCDKCDDTASKSVDVKVAGLEPISPSALYALYESDGSVIGAVKSRHESNHYLTPTAANMLLVIAINCYHQYPNGPVLHVNDASLMWGGVLDFDAEAEWNTPHKEHRRGTVVDIRANSKTGAIPSGNFDAFIQLAKDRGVHAKIHSQGQANQHFHVRLLNRSE
ncbi:MAG: hypothetical protein Q8O64_18690 [Sideroxyarcus sp.]|nr:hypothetical protein [Sideroxyarcus sp.]